MRDNDVVWGGGWLCGSAGRATSIINSIRKIIPEQIDEDHRIRVLLTAATPPWSEDGTLEFPGAVAVYQSVVSLFRRSLLDELIMF